VIAIDETAAPAETRPCLYCREPFDPEGNPERLYCTPRHKKKAADRRRHGNDPAQPPERTLTCPWCEAEFTTRLPNQVFCTTAHRKQAMTCERKRGFLTLLAAEVVAAKTIDHVEPYRCAAVGREHWHLTSVRRQSAPASADPVTRGDGP
jgi:hypothetical protein